MPYKMRRIAVQNEAYCSTNGRCTVGFPFFQGLEARKAQRYKWRAHCRTTWRSIAILSPRPVGVRVSETLLIYQTSATSLNNGDRLLPWMGN